ncbi:hypothetical protein ACTGZO_02290 [Streptococcus suis]
MKFTGNDVEIYNSFCAAARENLTQAKDEIKNYFENKSKESLQEYKEIIFVENERQNSGDEFVTNLWYSMFVPAIVAAVITLQEQIVQLFNIELGLDVKINIPLIITAVGLLAIVISYVWTHRPKHKKQVEETKKKKLLYFLEYYSN